MSDEQIDRWVAAAAFGIGFTIFFLMGLGLWDVILSAPRPEDQTVFPTGNTTCTFAADGKSVTCQGIEFYRKGQQ